MVKTANLLFILIVKQEKKFLGINLHENPKICVFTALNFAFNPQNSVPLKHTRINSKFSTVKVYKDKKLKENISFIQLLCK